MTMPRSQDATSIQLKKTTLALLNQTRAEEAGRLGGGSVEQDEFLRYLLNLYQAVKGDPVLDVVWKKMEKKVK